MAQASMYRETRQSLYIIGWQWRN